MKISKLKNTHNLEWRYIQYGIYFPTYLYMIMKYGNNRFSSKRGYDWYAWNNF